MATKIYLETGPKKTFAASLRWPGWARFARDEEAAIEALASYAPRYAPVVRRAGLSFPATADRFEVVQRRPGSGNLDFGVPDGPTDADTAPITAHEGERLASLVRAAWELFDEEIAAAPAELRKGPRGGGRDRDKMAQHVLSAEAAYARKIGVKHREPTLGDTDAIEALRADVLRAISTPTEQTWPIPYAARRFAWHVLDHVWEMQDRSS